MDVWEYTENVPTEMESICDLWSWSLNYETGHGPFSLFLDLIDYGEDYGGAFFQGNKSDFGFYAVELHKLAKALLKYADDPKSVREWIDGLIDADMRG